ncbi:MarR family winged helix-turn-helix transcriptional regulator [Caulobacter segnis]|uniref:MarR family winged helix-turn-helix transcriptional regulator n=1 Tax=Caulobacter segnis TaxID=88688 RepID=UPI002410205A|nr:MarR family winged helix-turn-helix transcriptional regulator [Caulobacter segnis]MDG2523139.1 MarR family winged helix-turn-helix transcriptional regulator [Caulobacter segnis]
MSKAAGTEQGAGLSLDDYLPFRLSIASNAVSKLIARAYEDRFGLTVPQWRLIAVLAEQPMTQQALVARTMMDKVMVSRAAQTLTTRNLVVRSAHEIDGRSHVLTLSDEGRRLYAEVAPMALDYEAALLTGLTPKDVTQMKRLLIRLEGAAAKLSGEDPAAS